MFLFHDASHSWNNVLLNLKLFRYQNNIFMYILNNTIIVKIDSIIWYFCLCQVCKTVYLIWVRKLTNRHCVKVTQSQTGVRYLKWNKHHLLHRIASIWTPLIYNTILYLYDAIRYDRNKLILKDIHNCQYIACMNPTAGSFTINPRLQRHFATFAIYINLNVYSLFN